VTYACFDITQLCSTARRRLVGSQSSNIYEGALQESEWKDYRQLQASSSGTANYGSVFAALDEEFVEVLGTNPFDINLAQAKAVIIFVSILICCFIFGTTCFLKWDAYDHNKIVYLRTNKSTKVIFTAHCFLKCSIETCC
jgi:hypothetical protein